MNTANLKIDIINKITQVQDAGIIKGLKQLLDFETNEGAFKTSLNQKNRIAAAKVEVKQKKFVSEASANKEIEEWLSK